MAKTLPLERWDIASNKTFTLKVVDFRPPKRYELYVGHDGKIRQLHGEDRLSRRAHKFLILKEVEVKRG